MIDLRSDTVTRPTPAMLDTMLRAPVGDDVFGDDPSVNALQEKMANLLGKEAALFCPTGTMANQIAIKLHTHPGDEVICDRFSHVYLNEGGGIAFHSGASIRLLHGDRGRFTAEQVRENVNRRSDSQYPYSRLVVIENTVTRAGGSCWSLDAIRAIRGVCDEVGLALHLDGARFFNALAACGETPGAHGAPFDTVSVCLSKGLGAPAGSVLAGSRKHIAAAHRLRKIMGGGMRQAGYLAAAGLYALDHHVQRLAEDHEHARFLGLAVAEAGYVETVLPVETNMVVFRLAECVDAEAFHRHLARRNILALQIAPRTMRFVLHLDVSRDQVARVTDALNAF